MVPRNQSLRQTMLIAILFHDYLYMRHFLKEDTLECKQKGTKKELKRSQKKEPKKGAERKLDILQRMEENPSITQVKLMEEFNLTRKQVQKIIKRLERR